MKKKNLLFMVIGGMFFAVGTAYALPETVNVPVSANITAIEVTVTKTGDLEFGTITPSPDEKTVRVNASGAGSGTAGAGAGIAATPEDGSILVSGGRAATIQLQATNAVNVTVLFADALTLTDGTNDLEVTAIRANSNVDGDGVATTSLVKDVPKYVHIGGELTVPGKKASGTYTANLPVTVAFE